MKYFIKDFTRQTLQLRNHFKINIFTHEIKNWVKTNDLYITYLLNKNTSMRINNKKTNVKQQLQRSQPFCRTLYRR